MTLALNDARGRNQGAGWMMAFLDGESKGLGMRPLCAPYNASGSPHESPMLFSSRETMVLIANKPMHGFIMTDARWTRWLVIRIAAKL